jgi:hypothetical protein
LTLPIKKRRRRRFTPRQSKARSTQAFPPGSCFKEYITPVCKSTAFFVGRQLPVDNGEKYDKMMGQ